MTTITQVITTLPTAPARSQAPATFITNADAHVASLSTLVSEINTWRGQANTVAGEVNTNATNAATSASTATTQASNASTSASNAATSESNAAASASNAATSESNAAASAAAAASSAMGFVGTSTTSLLIGTGSKTFTTQASEQYTAGIWVTATSQANPNNYMYGQVTSYSSTTLIVNVTKTGGSGTLADWNISLAGVQGETGIGITPQAVGWTGTAGTTPKTLTVDEDMSISALRASTLKSATTTVNISAATAPTSGQVLTATSGTTATWQTPTPGFTTGKAIAMAMIFGG